MQRLRLRQGEEKRAETRSTGGEWHVVLREIAQANRGRFNAHSQPVSKRRGRRKGFEYVADRLARLLTRTLVKRNGRWTWVCTMVQISEACRHKSASKLLKSICCRWWCMQQGAQCAVTQVSNGQVFQLAELPFITTATPTLLPVGIIMTSSLCSRRCQCRVTMQTIASRLNVQSCPNGLLWLIASDYLECQLAITFTFLFNCRLLLCRLFVGAKRNPFTRRIKLCVSLWVNTSWLLHPHSYQFHFVTMSRTHNYTY